MRLSVNGSRTEIQDGATVAGLVAAHAHEERRVAVAVNSEVVPRSRWETTVLAAGDRVELLSATAGG